MKLHEEIASQLNDKFVAAMVNSTGSLAPRNGIYYIRDVVYEPIGINGEIAIAYVNWKASSKEAFHEDVIFRIALSSLMSANPNATKHFRDVKELIGTVIQISHAYLVQKQFNGMEKQSLNCVWTLVPEQPSFIKKQELAIHSFFSNSTTGKEAFHDLINNAPYDVLEALDYEAQYGY